MILYTHRARQQQKANSRASSQTRHTAHIQISLVTYINCLVLDTPYYFKRSIVAQNRDQRVLRYILCTSQDIVIHFNILTVRKDEHLIMLTVWKDKHNKNQIDQQP